MASKKSFNTRQVMAGFGVSDMTIFTWRTATESREAIPHEINGRNVSFPESAVKAWAKKHGKDFNATAAEAALAPVKTGPKVAAKKVTPAKKAAPVKAKAHGRAESRPAA